MDQSNKDSPAPNTVTTLVCGANCGACSAMLAVWL